MRKMKVLFLFWANWREVYEFAQRLKSDTERLELVSILNRHRFRMEKEDNSHTRREVFGGEAVGP
jgi:hypothetical protein